MSQPPSYQPQYPPDYAPQGYAPPGYTPQGSFWPYYLRAPDELLGPARRASLMLFVIAGLLLLLGTCAGLGIAEATDAQFEEAMAEARRIDPAQAALYTPRLLRTAFGVIVAAVAIMGVAAIILGVVVRGGGRAAAVTALVLVSLPAALVGLSLVAALAANPAMFLMQLLVMAVPGVLIGLTIQSLIQAIRAAPELEAAQCQMQWMHQQHAMQYAAHAQQPQPQPQPPWPPQA